MSAPAPGTFVPSIFQFDSQAVRIFVDEQGKPWFCATDVCAVLDYANVSKAIKDHCRSQGITKRYTLTKQSRQELTFINEGNLYRLIIKSHLPAAERFEAWVCDEVLPAIRKTGKYEANPTQSSDQQLAPINLYDGIQKMLTLAMQCRALLPTPDYVLINRLDPDIREIIRSGCYTHSSHAIHLLTLSAAEIIKATDAPS